MTKQLPPFLNPGRHVVLQGILLFFLFLWIGMSNYGDYGATWDEAAQRTTGGLNYDYIFHGDSTLLTYKDRDYGAVYEMVLHAGKTALELDDYGDYYRMRRVANHVLFLLSGLVLYFLIQFLYQNKWLATIGFLMLVLHPRLYGHSFFNSKDVPFLCFLIFCFYTAAKAFDTKKIGWWTLAGLAAALLVNTRIMGVLFVLMVIGFLILDGVFEKKIKTTAMYLSVFLTTAAVALYVSWPYLWGAPFRQFAEAFGNMSKFRWGGTVLFNGRTVLATSLKWDYFPLWFGATTPLVYLAAGICGIGLLMWQGVRQPLDWFKNSKKRNLLLYFAFFMAPILAVIILKSVIYNGWRHLYFTYPGFLLLGIFGIDHVLTYCSRRVQHIVAAVFVLTFVFVGYRMVRLHPFEQIYFNVLVKKSPEHIRRNWDYDYWGSSFKAAYEHLLEADTSAQLHVAVDIWPGHDNLSMLPKSERQRIKIVDKDKATYFITDYLNHRDPYSEYEGQSFYKLTRQNSTVVEIFKLKK